MRRPLPPTVLRSLVIAFSPGIALALALIASAVSAASTVPGDAPQRLASTTAATPANATSPPLPMRRAEPIAEIDRFASAFRTIQQHYVDPVDDAALMEGAIRGLIEHLDPHSAYLPSAAMARFDEQVFGDYAGLGVEVFYMAGQLTVIAPIDGGPAARAGVEAGDVIVRVDGALVPQNDATAAVAMLRGASGSRAEIEVFRGDSPTPLRFTLVRETLRIQSVRVRMLDGDFALARIAQFQVGTGAELKERLRAQGAQHGRALRGLVLDLRSNPGGVVDAAIASADAFLDDGVIVSTRGRSPETVSESRATRGDVLDGAPIVVLIDRGSASAAEIVAGALKDQRRALVLGERSFGKGSIQGVYTLDNGDALKLTIGRYYTPSGRSIQAAGIEPDIVIPELRLVPADAPAGERERDLPGHLAGDEAAAAAPEAGDDAELASDYALREALTALKALALMADRASPR